MFNIYNKSVYLDSGSYYFDNVNFLPNGAMVPSGSVAAGTLQLEDGGLVDLSQLVSGQIYPFRSRVITVTLGNLYLYNGSLMMSNAELVTELGEQLITEDSFDLIMDNPLIV